MRHDRARAEFDGDVDDQVDGQRSCEGRAAEPEAYAGDVRLAVRIVTVHVAEEWPNGSYCRNDRTAFPCRMFRWGQGVLLAAGWTDEAIAGLVQDEDSDCHDCRAGAPVGGWS